MRYISAMKTQTLAVACFLAACASNEKPSHTTSSASTSPTALGAAAKPTAKPQSVKSKASTKAPQAEAMVGKPAPDFTLTSLQGKSVRLQDFRGKTVVLEWFNPDCPFVRQAHLEGNLKGTGSSYLEQGVVWLAINSNAPGRQGSSLEANKRGAEKFNIKSPILRDPSGKVGKCYGAKRTPQMYVIDPKGTLIYAGALDNSRGGDVADVSKPLLFVVNAIEAIAKKTPLVQASTKPWGCSVKYAR